MSDLGETESAMGLALEELRKLYAKDPENQLVTYWTKAKDDAVWEEFQTRFAKPEWDKKTRARDPAQAYVWGQYFLAIRQENERLEGVEVKTE